MSGNAAFLSTSKAACEAAPSHGKAAQEYPLQNGGVRVRHSATMSDGQAPWLLNALQFGFPRHLGSAFVSGHR
jgi:hypothetical protein